MSLHDIDIRLSQQIAELTRRLTIVEGHLEANRSSPESDRTPSTYTSNATTAPTHSLSGRDSVREPNEIESSLTNTIGVAETSKVVATPVPNYIYYRIYTDDGAIPSKNPVVPGDPYLGRIIARFVPPPRNAKAVKRSIAKVENIKDRESSSIFLTPYSESPMDDADKFTIHNGTGPGSTPQEPLALVAKMSDSERSALESDGRGGLSSTETTPPDVRHVYYVVYADDYAMPSKVAINSEELFVGRIRADSISPPHTLSSIKQYISRVERNPGLAHANLFADTSCDAPLKEGRISLLRTDSPGLSPNEPMAIVLVGKIPDALPVARASIPDGKYVIKNRAADIFLFAYGNPTMTVYFQFGTIQNARSENYYQWDIKHDINGNISMTSPHAPSSWVGANLAKSTVPVPWRLIPADSVSYYLTTDMNPDSQSPQVPAARSITSYIHGAMATLKKGDQWQMWEFIPV